MHHQVNLLIVTTLYISEAIYSNASLGESINSNYIIHQ